MDDQSPPLSPGATRNIVSSLVTRARASFRDRRSRSNRNSDGVDIDTSSEALSHGASAAAPAVDEPKPRKFQQSSRSFGTGFRSSLRRIRGRARQDQSDAEPVTSPPRHRIQTAKSAPALSLARPAHLHIDLSLPHEVLARRGGIQHTALPAPFAPSSSRSSATRAIQRRGAIDIDREELQRELKTRARDGSNGAASDGFSLSISRSSSLRLSRQSRRSTRNSLRRKASNEPVRLPAEEMLSFDGAPDRSSPDLMFDATPHTSILRRSFHRPSRSRASKTKSNVSTGSHNDIREAHSSTFDRDGTISPPDNRPQSATLRHCATVRRAHAHVTGVPATTNLSPKRHASLHIVRPRITAKAMSPSSPRSSAYSASTSTVAEMSPTATHVTSSGTLSSKSMSFGNAGGVIKPAISTSSSGGLRPRVGSSTRNLGHDNSRSFSSQPRPDQAGGVSSATSITAHDPHAYLRRASWPRARTDHDILSKLAEVSAMPALSEQQQQQQQHLLLQQRMTASTQDLVGLSYESIASAGSAATALVGSPSVTVSPPMSPMSPLSLHAPASAMSSLNIYDLFIDTSTSSRDVDSGELRALLTGVDASDFNVFELAEITLGRPLFHLALHLFEIHDFFRKFNIDQMRFRRFVDQVEESYRKENPYHNNTHAADVLQGVHVLISREPLRSVIPAEEKMALLVAAMVHDMDHPGQTGKFLEQTRSFIALLHGPVLEHHHTANAIALLATSDSNIFAALPHARQMSLRQLVARLVLATDMSKHGLHLGRFLEQLDNAGFPCLDNVQAMENAKCDSTPTLPPTPNETDMEDRYRLLEMCLKCADVSNPTRPWMICSRWSMLVMEEFFAQGDAERNLQVPISMLMDRYSTDIPASQVGFACGVVLPLFRAMGSLLPWVENELVPNVNANVANWSYAKEQVELLKTRADDAQREADRILASSASPVPEEAPSSTPVTETTATKTTTTTTTTTTDSSSASTTTTEKPSVANDEEESPMTILLLDESDYEGDDANEVETPAPASVPVPILRSPTRPKRGGLKTPSSAAAMLVTSDTDALSPPLSPRSQRHSVRFRVDERRASLTSSRCSSDSHSETGAHAVEPAPRRFMPQLKITSV